VVNNWSPILAGIRVATYTRDITKPRIMLSLQGQRLESGPFGSSSHGIGKKRRTLVPAVNHRNSIGQFPLRRSSVARNALTKKHTERLAKTKHVLRAIPDGPPADAQPHEALNSGEHGQHRLPLEQNSPRGHEGGIVPPPHPGRQESGPQVVGHSFNALAIGDVRNVAGGVLEASPATAAGPYQREAQDEVCHPERVTITLIAGQLTYFSRWQVPGYLAILDWAISPAEICPLFFFVEGYSMKKPFIS
jgi:hypothetical protein